MRKLSVVAIVLAVLLMPAWAFAQESPPAMVGTYDALADAILALKHAEADFVRSLLVYHFDRANMQHVLGHPEETAREMALFANEGDNAIAGIRKRLLDGGHHHNAAGEAEGIYERGYVIVTLEAKWAVMKASAAMRQAADEEAVMAAWRDFIEIASSVLHPEE